MKYNSDNTNDIEIPSMKIMCVSDVHINAWKQFSTTDEFGRPSRLNQFLQLALDIGQLTKNEKCDIIIIAGDISEKSIQQPHTLDVIGDFLRILATVAPVHLIHGNHDVDTKNDLIGYENSILKEICKDLGNYCNGINYHSSTSTIYEKEIKVVFQSWTHDHLIPDEKADVFVGHGLVTDAVNLDGYVFPCGFYKNELLERFRLSIVGDIHNGQYIIDERSTNAILIPGCPIQNTWKDERNCGVWTADIGIDGHPTLKFFNIHEVHKDYYHQFTYDEVSTDLIHSKPRIKKASSGSKHSKDSEIKIERNFNTIHDTCVSIIDQDKLQHASRVKECLSECFSNIKMSDDKNIANTVIKKIKVKNFLSILEFELDFDEFPSACVIIGKNGSGKTTVPEAVYWCLTGSTTKPLSQVSDVVNNLNGAAECSVELIMEVNGDTLSIVRTRYSSSSLVLKVNDNNISRGSIADTQKLIYEMLGLTDWQIKTFSYFSAEDTSLFAGLGESSQNELVNRIIGLDFLEVMREYAKNKKNELKDTVLKDEGTISGLEFQINGLKTKMTSLAVSLKSDSSEEIKKKIVKVGNDISFLKEELKTASESLKSIKIDGVSNIEDLQKRLSSKSNELNSMKISLQRDKMRETSVKTSINQKKGQLRSVVSGVCHACSQPLKNDVLVNSLKSEMESLIKELNEIGDSGVNELTITDLDKEVSELSNNINEMMKLSSTVDKKVNEIKSLNNTIASLNLELTKEKQDNSILEHVKSEIDSASNEKLKYQGRLLDMGELMECWKYIETNLLKKKGALTKKLNEQGALMIQSCIDKVVVNNNFTINIDKDLKLHGNFFDNKQVGYGSMSSGQKRVTDITMMVALNNLFSGIYNLKNGVLGLTIYDEILSFLDDEYVEVAKNIVDQSVSNKMLIVTHDPSLMNMYDSKLMVRMEKTGSVYTKSWK